MTTLEEVKQALSPLLVAFEADGITLDISLRDDTIIVGVTRSEAACEACVMPNESIEMYIVESLSEAGLSAGRIAVADSK